MHEPKLLLLAGDTHGNTYQIKYLIPKALRQNADAIFVLGDFGYWEHYFDGVMFLDETDALLHEAGLELFWLDGNHENHQLLRRRYLGEHFEDKFTEEKYNRLNKSLSENASPDMEDIPCFNNWGFAKVREHIWYVPRGTRWTWRDKKFLACGGAFSVDRYYRKQGVSFWQEETITDEDVEKSIGDGSPIDILLCHDVPAGVDIQYIFALSGKRFTVSPESEENRQRLRQIASAVRPTHVYHGHYHQYYTTYARYGPDENTTLVTGLDCDGSGPDSYTFLDLES